MIPRATSSTIPVARTAEAVPFAAWRELGGDAVVFGTVQKTDANTVRVQIRLFNVRARQSVFAKEYTGSATTPRLYAHTMSDEIHQQQRALRGVARTKLTFASDRNREKVAGPVQNRDVKEGYIADYDGDNSRRVTTNRHLNGTPQNYVVGVGGLNLRRTTTNDSGADRPTWAPAPFNEIAYAGRTGPAFDIKVYDLASGDPRLITFGEGSNESPAFSPNGRHIAFASTRGGRGTQIYTMGRDGKNVRQVTRDGNNYTPSWSN